MSQSTDQLISSLSEFLPTNEDGQQIEALLSKFVVVIEWQALDGMKYLSKCGLNGAGEPVPEWDKNGMLHEGLYGEW